MKTSLRLAGDRSFTFGSALSVALLVAALVVVLGPMILRGCSAVFFEGTVEFRRMQLDLFHRGDADALAADQAAAAAARKPVYDLLEAYQQHVGFADLAGPVRQAYRDFRKASDNDLAREVAREQIRDRLADAIDIVGLHGAAGVAEARKQVQVVLLLCSTGELTDEQAAARLKEARPEATADDVSQLLAHRRTLHGAPLAGLARLAAQFDEVLAREGNRLASLQSIEDSVRLLFGPPPGGKPGAVIQDRYGMTRMGDARGCLKQILYDTKYEQGVPVRVPRAEQFAGTELAKLFPMMESQLDAMMQPRGEFYWQFFFDDSTKSHFFGGVGPEIVGTVLVVVLCMAVAVPLSVVAAAYLTEFSREGRITKVIRTCINTLAGVPSIVFGLFGLAFFVLVFLPWFGFEPRPSLLAGSLTLAVLVLPVLIRASEEAIRAVPQTYREASLALGAGRLRAFVTVTLPAALPGILTGVILSLSRAAGETAPLLFAAAVAYTKGFTFDLHQRVRTLTYSSYDLAMNDRLASRVPHNQFGMVMTLISVVLLLNLVAIVVRSRMAKRLRGV